MRDVTNLLSMHSSLQCLLTWQASKHCLQSLAPVELLQAICLRPR